MEALQIIFNFLSIPLTALLTYLYTRSHYERKRKDDLADREFTRRAAAYDMRIKEVREYVDGIHNVISVLISFNTIFQQETTSERIELRVKRLESYNEGLFPSTTVMSINMDSISMLHDARLIELNKLLGLQLQRIYKWSKDLENPTEEIIQQKIKDAEDFLKFLLDTNNIVIQMGTRLDELSQSVK